MAVVATVVVQPPPPPRALLLPPIRVCPTRTRFAPSASAKRRNWPPLGNKPPSKLTDDIQNSDVELKANEDLLAMKKKEVEHINARYDEDKKRYRELTAKK